MISALLLLIPVIPAPLQGNGDPLPAAEYSGDAVTQDAAAPNGGEEDTTPVPTGSAEVEGLLSRVHQMRMNLLLGGEKVIEAEKDATEFYKEKSELVERRLDSVAAELAELRASYDISLENALDSQDEGQRTGKLREAVEQRQRMQSLEREEAELAERRTRLGKLVGVVEARNRERERLATRIDSVPTFDETMVSPLGDIGLAPELEALAPASLLEDEGLVADLLARDPVAAHRVLFEADPRGYWSLFPLQPPAGALRAALKFPPPDLPGQR